MKIVAMTDSTRAASSTATSVATAADVPSALSRMAYSACQEVEG